MALDTETTGFAPGQICQLSYIVFNESKVLIRFNRFYKVESVDEGASNVHGLTVDKLEELSGGLDFSVDIGGVIECLVAVDKIFIHNSPFDIRFMNAELERLGITFDFDKKAYCTMNHHTDIIKLPSKNGRGYKWPKLSETLDYYKISQDLILDETKKLFACEDTGLHDARFDVTGLYYIVKNMQL